MTADLADPLVGLDILVVEDETTISFLIEDMLTELGAASIRHAASIGRAEDLLKQKMPAAAVLDVNVAGQQIFPIAQRLDEKRIPFLFITGYGKSGLDGHFAHSPVIQKPFTLEQLQQGLREILS